MDSAAIATPYEDLLRDVLDNGTAKDDRTGTGTRSVFGRQLRYDLSESFPLLTTKKVYFHGVIGELLWFLRGESNVRWLQENNVRIWNEWANNEGDLGPVYGVQWRSWPTPDGRHVDQIQQALDTLRNNPDSRRNVVSAWNVSELDQMALLPCHLLFQLYVADGKLSLQVYQRSADPSSECRSTWPRTQPWRTCSPSRRAWKSATSFGRAETATSTPTTRSR